jgi:hypothetical protein
MWFFSTPTAVQEQPRLGEVVGGFLRLPRTVSLVTGCGTKAKPRLMQAWNGQPPASEFGS